MYDPKCHDIAEAFLSDFFMSDADREKQIARLAQEVQDTIESWIECDDQMARAARLTEREP